MKSVSERLNEYRKSKQADPETGSVNIINNRTTSVRDRLNTYRSERAVNTFADTFKKLSDNYTKNYNSAKEFMKEWQNPNAYKNIDDSMRTMKYDYDNLINGYQTYKDSFIKSMGRDNYQNALSYLQSVGSSIDNMSKGLKSQADLYSNYMNANEYLSAMNQYKQETEERDRLMNLDLNELRNQIKSKQDEVSAYKKSNGMGSDVYNSYSDQLAQIEQKMLNQNTSEEEAKSLREEYNRIAALQQSGQPGQDLNKLQTEYEKANRLQTEANDKAFVESLPQEVLDSFKSYKSLQNSMMAPKRQIELSSSVKETMGWDDAEFEDAYKKYDAYSNLKTRESNQAINQQFASEHPWLSSLSTLPTNLASGIGYVDIFAQQAANQSNGSTRPIDLNTPYLNPYNYTQDVRNQVLSDIESGKTSILGGLEKYNMPDFLGGQNAGSFTYNTLMSAADSAVNMLASSAIGYGTGLSANAAKHVVSGMMNIIMGSQVATDQSAQMIESGVPANEALAMGAVYGAIEGISETLSVETIIGSVIKGDAVWKTALKSFLSEGGEEVESNWMGRAAEMIEYSITGHESEFVSAYLSNQKNGDSPIVAFGKACMQFLPEDAASFIAGGISGLAMSGTTGAVYNTVGKVSGTMRNVDINKQSGQNAFDNMTYQNIGENAKAILPENSRLAKLAADVSGLTEEKISKQNKVQQSVTKYKVGQLASKTVQSVDTQSQQILRDGIKNQLVSLGVEENSAVRYSKVLSKQLKTGDFYMPKGINEKDTGAVSSVISDMRGEYGKNAKWVSDITDKVNDLTSKAYNIVKDTAPLMDSEEVKTDSAKTERSSVPEIDHVEDGTVYVKNSSGDVVSSDNVDISNADSAEIISSAANMSTDEAKLFASVYTPGTDTETFTTAWNAIKHYGEIGMPYSDAIKSTFVSGMTPAQTKAAYSYGRNLRMKKAESQSKAHAASKEKAAANGSITVLSKRVSYDQSVKGKKLSKKQMSAIYVAKRLSEAMGIDVVLYSSGGVGANGKYTSGGKVWLDIDAGAIGEQAIIRTMAHELTHFAKEFSALQYEEFKDFLFGELNKYDNDTVQRLMVQQKELAKNYGIELTEEQALDEVIADACEMMLKDGSAIKRLAMSNLSTKSKILAFLKNIIDRIAKAFENVNATSNEYAALQEAKADFKKLQQMWNDMLTDATETFNAVAEISDEVSEVSETDTEIAPSEMTQNSFRSLAQAAGFMAEQDSETGNKYYVRDGSRVKEINIVDIEASPIGAMINQSVADGVIDSDTAKKQKKFFVDLCNLSLKVNDFSMAMQFAGSSVFTALKMNSDKQYGTTYDMDSICVKTQAVIDAMSAKMVQKGDSLTESEIKEIYQQVFAKGLPVPCPECYVFSRWVGIGGLLHNIKTYQDRYGKMSVEDVIRERDSILAEIQDYAKANGIENKLGQAKSKIVKKYTDEYNKLAKKIAEQEEKTGEYSVSQSDRDLLAVYEGKMDAAKAVAWINTVYLKNGTKNPKAFVPDNVLFDLNKGDEFATQYADAWAFRTTQGSQYGKAITPYTEAVLGEGILVLNNGTKAIKAKQNNTLNNPFSDSLGELSKDAKNRLKTAKAKQLAQYFLGGQRFQSTSDSKFSNASDYILAILELQSMQGAAQVYTKVSASIPFFDAAGCMINQSLMPLNGGIDDNGNLMDTSNGGMDKKLAFENRKKYVHAGTVTIGVNDEHIRKLINDENRDFVIPYHVSGGKYKLIAEFRRIQDMMSEQSKMIRSTDYTQTQSDKILSDEVLKNIGKTDAEIDMIHKVRETRIAIMTRRGAIDMDVVNSNRFLKRLYNDFNGGEWDGVKLQKNKIEAQIYPNEFWDKSLTYSESGKITQDYLDYCDSLGFLHRFSGQTPKKGKLVYLNGRDRNGEKIQMTDLAYNEDGSVNQFFWKLLVDRRMYDNDGNYLPQNPVTLSNVSVETASTFAKPTGDAREGRQYNKLLSDELVKEMKSGNDQFSLRKSEESNIHTFSEQEIVDQTYDFISNSFYDTTNSWGFRVDDYDYNIGDVVNNSHELYQDAEYDDDGNLIYPEGTGVYQGYYDAGELDGASSVGIDANSIGELQKNIESSIKASHSYVYGNSQYLYLIRGLYSHAGNDAGEAIIPDAVVEKKYRINEDGTYTEEGLNQFSFRKPYESPREILSRVFADQSPEYKSYAEALKGYQDTLDKMNRANARLEQLKENANKIRTVKLGTALSKDVYLKNANDRIRLLKQNARSQDAMIEKINQYESKLSNYETHKLKKVIEQEQKNAVAAEKLKGKEKLNDYRQNLKTTEVRNKLKKVKQDIVTTLKHPKETKYVPPYLVDSMLNVCDLIDTSTGKPSKSADALEKTIQKLRDGYEQLKNDPDPNYSSEYDAQVLNDIDGIKQIVQGRSIYEMNAEELNEMYRIVKLVMSTLRDATKLIDSQYRSTIAEAGINIIKEQRSIKSKKSHTGKMANAKDGLADLLNRASNQTISTMRNVERMCGYDTSSPLYKLFEDLNEGVRKQNKFIMDAEKSFASLMEGDNKVKYQKASTEKIATGLIDFNGNEISMTRMQIMQTILTWQREQSNENLVHMSTGGIEIPDVEKMAIPKKRSDAMKNAQRIIVNDQVIEKMKELIQDSDYCTEFMDKAKFFFNDTAKKAINETMRLLKHYDIANSKDYIPYYVNKDFVVSDIDSTADIPALIANSGFLKETADYATQSIFINGLDSVLKKHINDVGKVYGLAIPTRNINKVWNFKLRNSIDSVKDAFGRAWGESGTKLIVNAVQDLQRSRAGERSFLDKVSGNFASATLGFNLSVVMKQAASLSTAYLYLDYRNFAKTFADFISTCKNYQSIIEEIDQHTAQHYMRRQGLSTQELGDIASSMSKMKTEMDKLPTFANPVKWIQGVDCLTTATFWNMCKEDVQKKNKGIEIGSELYWKKVTDLYDKVIEETQPMYDVLHRTELQKGTGVKRLIIMFKTQPLQNAGIMYNSYGEMLSAKQSKNEDAFKASKRKFCKAVGSQVESAVVFSVMTLIGRALLGKMNRYKDDDDNVTVGTVSIRILLDTLNSLSGVVAPPFGSDVMSFFENIHSGNYYNTDMFTVPALGSVNEFITSVAGLFNGLNADSISKVIIKGSSLAGIPAQNVVNFIGGIKNMITSAVGLFDQNRKQNAANKNAVRSDIDRMIKNAYNERKRNYPGETENELQKAAESAVKTKITAVQKKAYLSAYLSKNQTEMNRIKTYLSNTGLYSDVDKTVNGWVSAYEDERRRKGTK